MGPRLDRLTRRATAAVGALAVGLAGALTAVSAAAPAAADTAPSDTTLPRTVSSDALPTAQINGVVWDQQIIGNTVYVGGEFTAVRPAGAAPGVSTVARTNLMAYDIRTGQYTAFAPRLNSKVEALGASPDGSRLYVGGNFTDVNGDTTRDYLVAYSTATGALDAAFKPSVNGAVRAITATSSTVYLGGVFSSVGGQERVRIAAVNTAGAVQASIGNANDQVRALQLSPTASHLIVGGAFTTFNGASTPGYGLARVDLATRQSVALPANNLIRNGGANSAITSLSGDAQYFYGSGYHFGSGGNLEGSFAARWSDGAIEWVEDCHGDTHQSFAIGGVIYSASHKHYCGNIGGFPEFSPRQEYRATATTTAARGTVTRDPHGYFNFAGNKAPQLLNWFPAVNSGTFTGQSQGPFAVTGTSEYVVMGGEFTKVNGTGQQGLVRFAVSAIAPDKDAPRQVQASVNPRVRSVKAGEVRVSWPAYWDRDNATLTHRVYRTTTTSPTTPPNYEKAVTAPFWSARSGTFVDTAPGATPKYLLAVSDPMGNTTKTSLVGVTTATTTQPYPAKVFDDGASLYWRLGEASGTAVQDWVGFTDATAGTGVTRGAPGAVAGDGASAFNGTSTGFAAARTIAPEPGPNTFTVEAWVKTSSTAGGKIVGYGNALTGGSTSYDRHLYMDNAGKIYFGVNSNGTKTVSSTQSYNNGAWHHVAASLGSGGLKLYVDGALVGSRTDATAGQAFRGYWRIGGDSLGPSWAGTKTSGYLNGSIDEVAVYPTALSATQIAGHEALGGPATASPPADAPAASPPADAPAADEANAGPTASFTATTDGLAVTVDGSASSDPDGAVASYAWDFGDGTTATGPTASHTYAAPGTYTVGLRVTDDAAAAASTTQPVTVTAATPPALPAGELARDAFDRTVTGGWGTAAVGGAWATSGAASSFSVDGGVGRQVLPAPGRDVTSVLAGSSTDTEVQVVVGLGTPPTGGGTYVSVIGRKVGTAGDYRARLRLYPTGVVNLQAARGGTAVRAVDVPGLSYAAGDRLAVRLQVTGTSPTTLRVKTWPAGDAEPDAWQITATDATPALQAGGGVGVGTYLSSTSTNAPAVATYDDLWAGAPRG
ncbi:LamG-like jellyroll fold domain-containing protein [Cellulomonas aerilata]|uniref:PKD domain-containing protein n=1 Tax=Cellulomonas aerilata TaxID=515326 RepID=A0A512DDV1_9CELL|nr:LamG-like jellyroll fold domain-containing protein [Cellulomonas aerilata]GEO34642.1 hypothetical protein CAE01nite_23670 [Cellulomonas aerilata]